MSTRDIVLATRTGRALALALGASVLLAVGSLGGGAWLGGTISDLEARIEREGAAEDAHADTVADVVARRDEARQAAAREANRALRLGETAEQAYARALAPRDEHRYEESNALLDDLIARFPESEIVERARAAIQENGRLARASRTQRGGG